MVAEVEALLAAGLVFQAYETASAGLERAPESTSLRILRALALVRTGAVREAVDQLGGRLDAIVATERGGDLAGIVDVYQEAWRQSGTASMLVEAARFARLVAGRQRGTWPAARAAALTWLAGQPQQARELASMARTCGRQHGIWDEAGLLVAGAIVGIPPERLVSAARATAEAAGADYAPLVALRQLLTELAAAGLPIPEPVLAPLRPPTVVVFTGHDLDRPGQAQPRLTAARLPALRAELDLRLERLRARIGYVSPSAGANLLFVEAMLDRGAEVSLVLPFAREDFVRHCVAFAGAAWVKRFERAVARSAQVSYASEGPYLGHDLLFRYGNQILHGLATLRARFLGTAPHLLAVWDCEEGSLAGDAADFIDQWGDIARLSIVDLSELPETGGPDPPVEAGTMPELAPVRPARELRAMLFADILGFGRLTDAHIPAFLDLIERLRAGLEDRFRPELVNSWGDALFVVMDEASPLAAFALALRDLVQCFGASDHGFPGDLAVRISLHAGPVYRMQDPFTRRTNFWGSDINRAARLEPVTVPGQVYATQPFVALLTSEQSVAASEARQTGRSYVAPFVCEYVGLLPLAKNFGAEPVYHVRARCVQAA
jgi:class 3 adenylate cyclase